MTHITEPIALRNFIAVGTFPQRREEQSAIWPRGKWLSELNERINTMPKMKTNRGAAKRFKITGNGKIAYSKSYASHILTKKTTKRKRNLRKSAIIGKADVAAVRRLIPYA